MNRTFRGRAVSPGVAGGSFVRWDRPVAPPSPPSISSNSSPQTDERARLAAAFAHVERELDALHARSDVPDAAALIDVQRAILHDPRFREEIERTISSQRAEQAVATAVWRWTKTMEAVGSARQLERAADLRDFERRLLRALTDTQHRLMLPFYEPCVLAAARLYPSELIEIGREGIAALCLFDVGPSSHIVLLARALRLPVVLCKEEALIGIPEGAYVEVDGGQGVVRVGSNEDALAALPPVSDDRNDVRALRELVRVSAAVGSVAEARAARAGGASGVGLLRTEFLFADRTRTTAPTIAEQTAAYGAIAEFFPDDPVTIRLFDGGGDKPLSFLPHAPETNPALGTRGLRLLLEHPKVLRDQMRAIAALADAHAHLRVLVPMVTHRDELVHVRRIFDDICADLAVRVRPRFGAMIEVPAAALTAESLAEYVDFFSIGTNDLAQYTLAADRDDARYAEYGDAAHSAVLGLIQMTVRAAHAQKRTVSICGEAAGRAATAVLFVGSGVDELVIGF